MTIPELYILRHGETEWNAVGRMQGRLDSPLTLTGQDQARAQGQTLRANALTGLPIYCSPSGRARKTAELAVPEKFKEIRFDARLMEIDLGHWQGRVKAELEAEFPQAFAGDSMWGWYDRCPQGEGFAGLEQRTASFLADLTGPAILFTHGITSRFLRCHALGMPMDAFGTLPGGQGIIHHVKKGSQKML